MLVLPVQYLPTVARMSAGLDTPEPGGTGHRGGDRGTSDAQRQATGFAGEYLAWHWLTARYEEANETSWVSTNRRHLLTGDPGDDGLGYDLEVHLGRNPLMFEVKAFLPRGSWRD